MRIKSAMLFVLGLLIIIVGCEAKAVNDGNIKETKKLYDISQVTTTEEIPITEQYIDPLYSKPAEKVLREFYQEYSKWEGSVDNVTVRIEVNEDSNYEEKYNGEYINQNCDIYYSTEDITIKAKFSFGEEPYRTEYDWGGGFTDEEIEERGVVFTAGSDYIKRKLPHDVHVQFKKVKIKEDYILLNKISIEYYEDDIEPEVRSIFKSIKGKKIKLYKK